MEGSVFFKSDSVEWGTPDEVLAPLRKEFQFVLDTCASSPAFAIPDATIVYTPDTDGLKQDWARGYNFSKNSPACIPGLTLAYWMNPPYGRVIKDWVAKAAEEARAGCTTVALLPARTDTKWWHSHVQPILEKHGTSRVRFLRGRVRFVKPDGTRLSSAPFSSVVVVFAP